MLDRFCRQKYVIIPCLWARTQRDQRAQQCLVLVLLCVAATPVQSRNCALPCSQPPILCGVLVCLMARSLIEYKHGPSCKHRSATPHRSHPLPACAHAQVTNENDGASADSSAWWLQHLVVVDRTASTQQSVVKHYFWFNRWLRAEEGLSVIVTALHTYPPPYQFSACS